MSREAALQELSTWGQMTATATDLTIEDVDAIAHERWPNGHAFEAVDGSYIVVGLLNQKLHAWGGRTPAEAAREAMLIGVEAAR